MRIDLRKVDRLEGHADAELRQTVIQLLCGRIEQMHGLRPLRLQPPLHRAVLRGKSAQAPKIRLTQAFQMSQYQRDDGVAAGQFDLWTGFPGVHGLDQRTQGQQQITDRSGQHAAHLHIGNVTALALVKTDQHGALLAHITHRQACPVAVSPGRTLDGSQNHVRLDLAQMPQVVFHDPLLDRHLGRHVQMLHLATATGTRMQTEMRATGLHALRRLA